MNGGLEVTSGGDRRARLLALLLFAGVGLAFAIVNALSVTADYSRLGRTLEPWEPWVWELTSVVAFLLVAPPLMWLSLRLRPPRISWASTLAAHVFLSVAVSMLHVTLMTGLREAIYAVIGGNYEWAGSLPEMLVYEYRKDLITYAAIAALPHITRRLLRPADDAGPSSAPDWIEVRDGTRLLRLRPAEIEWAQSAGNYVELHGGFGSILYRRTLAALEEQLDAHGFTRIHRSRIVRSCAIAAVETNPSGDFEVTLASGTKIGGSRRFRGNLGLKAPASAA